MHHSYLLYMFKRGNCDHSAFSCNELLWRFVIYSIRSHVMSIYLDHILWLSTQLHYCVESDCQHCHTIGLLILFLTTFISVLQLLHIKFLKINEGKYLQRYTVLANYRLTILLVWTSCDLAMSGKLWPKHYPQITLRVYTDTYFGESSYLLVREVRPVGKYASTCKLHPLMVKARSHSTRGTTNSYFQALNKKARRNVNRNWKKPEYHSTMTSIRSI